MTLPRPRVVENVDIVVCPRLRFVRAVRAGDGQPDRVGRLAVGQLCPGVPEPGVIRQDPDGAQDAVCEPDEGADPEGGVVFPKEYRDVAALVSIVRNQVEGGVDLQQHCYQHDDREHDVDYEEGLIQVPA